MSISTSHLFAHFTHVGDNRLLDEDFFESHNILPFPIDQSTESSHVQKNIATQFNAL